VESRKKAYRHPELTVYGDVRELTKSANKEKGDDNSGMGGGNSKTA
jgi:hypothetical protein